MKKFFPLSPRLSDWIVVAYIAVTLALRFMLEPQLQGNVIISMALGAFALLFLWALIKSKILQPDYFGWFAKKEQ